MNHFSHFSLPCQAKINICTDSNQCFRQPVISKLYFLHDLLFIYFFLKSKRISVNPGEGQDEVTIRSRI